MCPQNAVEAGSLLQPCASPEGHTSSSQYAEGKYKTARKEETQDNAQHFLLYAFTRLVLGL